MEIDFTPQERFDRIISILAEGVLNLLKKQKGIFEQFLHLRVVSSVYPPQGALLVDTSALVYVQKMLNFSSSNSGTIANVKVSETISKHVH